MSFRVKKIHLEPLVFSCQERHPGKHCIGVFGWLYGCGQKTYTHTHTHLVAQHWLRIQWAQGAVGVGDRSNLRTTLSVICNDMDTHIHTVRKCCVLVHTVHCLCPILECERVCHEMGIRKPSLPTTISWSHFKPHLTGSEMMVLPIFQDINWLVMGYRVSLSLDPSFSRSFSLSPHWKGKWCLSSQKCHRVAGCEVGLVILHHCIIRLFSTQIWPNLPDAKT